MSAFVSIVHEHGCHLFTDGAVWAPDQTLIDIRHKATIARSGHLAVTSIGDAEVGSTIARDICERADRLGNLAHQPWRPRCGSCGRRNWATH